MLLLLLLFVVVIILLLLWSLESDYIALADLKLVTTLLLSLLSAGSVPSQFVSI